MAHRSLAPADRYIRQALLYTAVLLALTALGNYAIDPYGIYGAFVAPGLNGAKPGQRGHDRLVKAYAIRHQLPDALLLGTSRVQYGLDPNDPHLLAHARRPYNAGLLGSNVYLAQRYLQHAQALGHVEVAVLGIDPLMLVQADPMAARDFSEARLAVDAAGHAQPLWFFADVPAALLSWDASRMSLRTLRKQGQIVQDLLPSGQRSPGALRRLYHDGRSMMARFAQVDATYARDYRAARWPALSGATPELDAIDALVAAAQAGHTRLEIYFTPEHAHLREVAEQVGAADTVAAVRRAIAERVLAAAARDRSTSVRLWDMDILSPVACEAVPGEGDELQDMQWFWEPTHARANFGHLVLERMLAETPSHAAHEVGRPIDSMAQVGTAEERRAALRAWEAQHAGDVAAVRAAVQAPPTPPGHTDADAEP